MAAQATQIGMKKTTETRPDKSRPRDPERTRAQIMDAALQQFAANGYHGAKIDDISKAAACNARLIYHYYGSKEGLYLAALARIYSQIRDAEKQLNLDRLPPRDAMRALVEFTFDFFDTNVLFGKITRNENLLGGRFINKTTAIQEMSHPLIAKIGEILERGVAEGVFTQRCDPLQLYVTIVAISAHHLNAVHTLSATFGEDLSDPDWRADRRAHAVAFVLNGLGATESHTT